MLRQPSSVFVLASVALYLTGASASAQTLQSLFFDNFSSYNLGTLDKNDTLTPGPNQAANGSGNPWFGPEISSPNLVVVGPENGVTPVNNDAQMVRGRAPSDFDQDWYNLAYRLNNGMPFLENIALDWWFYDPPDPNDPNADPTTFYDFVALAYYDTVPSDRDGPDSVSTWDIATGVGNIQRLSLGAGNPALFGYDPTMYQARVAGADDGLANGWFNTNTPRALGWHHGMIVVGPMQADATNDVTFFIDDLTNPTLDHNSVTSFGYNVIELNANYKSVTGYYDDINFSIITQ